VHFDNRKKDRNGSRRTDSNISTRSFKKSGRSSECVLTASHLSWNNVHAEVSCQLQTLIEKTDHRTHCTGGWVSPRYYLVAVAKKWTSCPAGNQIPILHPVAQLLYRLRYQSLTYCPQTTRKSLRRNGCSGAMQGECLLSGRLEGCYCWEVWHARDTTTHTENIKQLRSACSERTFVVFCWYRNDILYRIATSLNVTNAVLHSLRHVPTSSDLHWCKNCGYVVEILESLATE
jgi:hypothetical protein